ncbi:hypothetical protein F5882DRAFT_491650 [Hyaloscypha sp. PMI_1271]|nr:hypothetical protein F5882DRAFT_491650 [Hyaloscypha sp. PMI_1271]
MNITNCCLFALNDAFVIRDGYLVVEDSSFLSPGTTPESFLADMDNGQFPCGSNFNGTEVKATYTWCSIHCPGWQKSDPKDTQEWVSPLVSFILPCLVFSTTIPRRRRLQVSDVLFKPTLHDMYRLMLTPVRFLVAIVIVTIDVLIWLALCFAFSGPMILSGVFEAFLDRRILDFVKEGKNGLTKVMSKRLLYIILVGNLDFRWKTGESIAHVGVPNTTKHRPVFGVFAQAYESRYKTEWLWFRGRSKYFWLQRAFLLDNINTKTAPKPQLTNLQSAINFSIFDWAKMLIITTALIFVPFILAFLTTISQDGTLHSPAHPTETGLPNLTSCITYWTLATLFIGTSIFAAIGGTIMQLLGVYSNCLCALPVKYWSVRYTDEVNAYVNLGSNSAADISAAQKWWMAMGSTATAFLCVATYFGWWYQRRLRGVFRDVAEKI